jgi:hypothetical protein
LDDEMFVKEATQPVTVWAPDPDDQAAHNWLLAELTRMGLPFSSGSLSTRMQGNLGESCCMIVGANTDLKSFACFPANAHQPLQDISRSELDLVWVWLDANPMADHIVFQEVKTTGDATLGYADTLLVDYQKLFGTDPATTLHTRLNAIANVLEYGHQKVPHADRVRTLAALTPQATTNVLLLPSVVYDRNLVADPSPKMAAVRQSVIAAGWAPNAVESWAVGLGDLLDRLARLKAGSS